MAPAAAVVTAVLRVKRQMTLILIGIDDDILVALLMIMVGGLHPLISSPLAKLYPVPMLHVRVGCPGIQISRSGKLAGMPGIRTR